MTYEALTPLVADAAQRAQAAGADAGNELKLLFAIPGFSLTYVWFKSDFPLPRHSHNVDCLYYILAGSLMVGQEQLGAGDGFFVGQDRAQPPKPVEPRTASGRADAAHVMRGNRR